MQRFPSGKGTATVGYNVQIAVDAEHHLIVAHEVTNQGYDRHQLAPMAFKAQQATGCEQITALADRARGLALGVQQWLAQALEGQVYWVETDPARGQRADLVSAPIEVGPALREELYSKEIGRAHV